VDEIDRSKEGQGLANDGWEKMSVEKNELNLQVVLKCGQSFRWTFEDDAWIGILKERLFILKQTEGNLLFKVCPGEVLKLNTESQICCL